MLFRSREHDFLPFCGVHPAVKQADAVLRKYTFKSLLALHSVSQIGLLGFLNGGIDDIDLPALFNLFPQERVDLDRNIGPLDAVRHHRPLIQVVVCESSCRIPLEPGVPGLNGGVEPC